MPEPLHRRSLLKFAAGAVTSGWLWPAAPAAAVYLFPLKDAMSVPMLRVLDSHGGNTDIAEVQLLRFVR